MIAPLRPMPSAPTVTAASAATAATAATAPLDLRGLSASISRPLTAGNGDYSVTIDLHPPELGGVHALLTLRGEQLQVTLVPEQESGRDALATALPSLRDQLGGNGVEVTVTLGQPREQAGSQSDPQGPAHAATRSAPNDPTPAAPTTAPTTLHDARIHVVL